ncbi:SDR family oxidoreductase [candidate division KSB1 bacterium]|nr:SDR family oxidoreductase [candidate division KSB1 bacterium]NIR71738.1 SDR family oxidoreductase [candidate division KSB1 bacterium]NIS26419.1 SDR family oxidoreductase [candidate division KSB1 bacterium]NIT73178.1 SDR family oxidoreductase [candidate division KSB1 bacterium]NIU27105.1 SDR family oxidoreductase [candidate division KSB1 bacterium]
MTVENKVAIITGATGGLGKAVTHAFLENGARVATLASREASLKGLKEQLSSSKGDYFAIATNLLDESSVKSMVEQVLDKYDRIDCLINLVGGFLGGVSISETSGEQWDNMFNLNLKSAFLCCKHVLPVMKKQKSGSIVNIGSKGGIKAVAGMSAYSASKAGVINLTEALAAEGRDDNITANVVVPSIIDTPANRQAMPNADFENWVTPETIASTILFFCSDHARDISGSVVPVYGKA